jgi:hypothetical protein
MKCSSRNLYFNTLLHAHRARLEDGGGNVPMVARAAVMVAGVTLGGRAGAAAAASPAELVNGEL